MNKEQIIKIGDDRLGRWKERLASEHATPVILLGVTHDHNSGKIVLCTLEEMGNFEIRLFIKDALTLLG